LSFPRRRESIPLDDPPDTLSLMLVRSGWGTAFCLKMQEIGFVLLYLISFFLAVPRRFAKVHIKRVGWTFCIKLVVNFEEN